MIRRHKFLFAFLGLIGIGIAILVAVIVWLGSPSGSNFILSKGKAFLEKDGHTRLEYREGSLALFSGAHFRDLHFTRDQAPLKADVFIRAVDLDYRLSLLGRRLEVRELKLDHPAIVVEMNGEAPAEEKPAAQKPGKSLDDLLKSPPLEVSLHGVEIHSLDLRFDKKNGDQALHAVIRELSLGTELELKRELVESKGDFSVAQGIEVRQNGAADFDLRMPKLIGRWQAGIRRENGQWIYEVFPTHVESELRDVTFAKPGMKVGLPKARFDLEAHLRAHSSELLRLSPHEEIENVVLKTLVSAGPLTIEQGAQRSSIDGIQARVATELKDKVRMEALVEAARLDLPKMLTHPARLKLTAVAVVPRDLAHLEAEGALELDRWKLVTFKATGENAEGDVHVVSRLDSKIEPGLAGVVRPAAALRKTGTVTIGASVDAAMKKNEPIRVKMNADLGAEHLPPSQQALTAGIAGDTVYDGTAKTVAFNGTLDVVNRDFGTWKMKTDLSLAQTPGLKGGGRAEISEVRPGDPKFVPVLFAKAMTITHRFDLNPGPGSGLEITADIPSIEKKGLARVTDTHLEANVRSPDLSAARDVDVNATVRQGPIELDPRATGAMLEHPPKIGGASIDLKASVRDKVRVSLDQLEARVDGELLHFTAHGAGNTATRDLQAQSRLSVSIPPDFPAVAGQSIRGEIEVPATLSVLRGSDIALVGDVGLHGVSLVKGGAGVGGLSGRIPFSEKLRWDGTHIRFAHLITQNPFERVDFERVRPLLDSASQLRIEKMHWEEKTYGPFVGFFSIQQNMISAHQFDMDAGHGRIYGEMFLNAYPASLEFGLLSRLTGLDLGEVLPKRFLARAPGGDKMISARSGFVVNLNRAAIDGRVDVTEIGGPQLIALINIIDPKYEDEKMNKVRGLLQVGAPTAVELSFAEGYMNMDIDLSVLGVTKHESLREIPISSLLSQATSEIVKKTAKGPLQ